MSLIYGDTRDSLDNRRDFLKELGIDYRDLICAKQVHGDRISCVTIEDKGKGALSYVCAIDDTDALITKERDLPLAIFTADCLSVFVYDPLNQAVGLVHAGWRSTKEHILVKTIGLMQELFNTKTSDLHVGFGPAIRECCYAVGEDFNDFFPLDVTERDRHFYLDLPLANKRQILELGVKEANIFDSGTCTFCQNNEFFSYRKEGNSCGRMMSVIMLK